MHLRLPLALTVAIAYGAAAASLGGRVGGAMLAVAALALLGLALGRGPAPAERRDAGRPGPAPPAPRPAAAVRTTERLPHLLELARRAAAADEAALWRLDEAAGMIRLAARAAASDAWETPFAIAFDDGPFSAAIAERQHVRLERGRRELPAPWAAEMLLVPAGDSGELLSLAYADGAPDGAEHAAVAAAEALRPATGG